MGALTDKYRIVGVGETPHRRPSNPTTLSKACEAVKKATADAGLNSRDIRRHDQLPGRRLHHVHTCGHRFRHARQLRGRCL